VPVPPMTNNVPYTNAPTLRTVTKQILSPTNRPAGACGAFRP